MELTINIQAPELAHALETLANAMGNVKIRGTKQEVITQQPEPQQSEPQQLIPNAAPTAPTQQPQMAPVQTVPTQAPVQQQQAPQQSVPTQTQQQTTPQTTQQAVPTQAQTYTMDQLAIAATQIMDAGKRNELVNLLAQFGVQALTALPKEQYGAFATALRGMGARI